MERDRHGTNRPAPTDASRKTLVRRATPLAIALLALLPVCAAAAECTFGVMGELPVTLSGGHPMIKGTVNGIEASFIADSGAFYSVLTGEGAERFHMKLGPMPFGMQVVGIGGVERTQLGTAREFTLAGLNGGPLHNVEFIVGSNSFAHVASGIIGQNVLGFADIEFDLANGVIRLIRSKDCSGRNLAYWHGTKDYAVLDIESITRQAPHIVGRAMLNGMKIRVMFDTGFGSSMLTKRAAARAGVKVDDPGVVTGGESAGGFGGRPVETWIAPFQSLDLGGEKIQNIRLRVGDIDSRIDADLLLGIDFFLSHRLYVAQKERKVFFTYNGGPVFDLSHHGLPAAAEPAAPDTGRAEGEALDGPGYLRRGTAAFARRDYAGAIADFDRAAALAPEDPEVYYHRALARWWTRDPVLAMADVDQALALRADMGPALLLRGELRLGHKDDAGARADFDAVATAPRADAFVLAQIGLIYQRHDRSAEAIEHFSRWIAANPKDDRLAKVLAYRCRARAAAGTDLGLALRDCDESIRSMKSTEVLDSRALVKLRLGDLDGAISDYKAALSLQSVNASSRYGLGLAQLRKGLVADGDANLQAALGMRAGVADEFKRMGLAREP